MTSSFLPWRGTREKKERLGGGNTIISTESMEGSLDGKNSGRSIWCCFFCWFHFINHLINLLARCKQTTEATKTTDRPRTTTGSLGSQQKKKEKKKKGETRGKSDDETKEEQGQEGRTFAGRHGHLGCRDASWCYCYRHGRRRG